MDYSNAIATLFLVIIALVLVALNKAGHKLIPTAYAEELPYEQQLRDWVDKLAYAESGNNYEQEPFLDSNKKYSYSCLQFQKGTWEAYTEKYQKHPGEFADINDCKQQKELAYRMIYDHYNNWGHWRCSVVNTNESELCTAAFNKLGWEPKQGIGKPPLRELRENNAECKIGHWKIEM